MKALEYRYLFRRLDIEIYLGLVALISITLGMWLGYQLINSKTAVTTRSLSASIPINLSERESQVLQLMADGHSNQEIADHLYISIHTVKTHTSNLFAKLDAKRRTQAIVRAKQMGIIQ